MSQRGEALGDELMKLFDAQMAALRMELLTNCDQNPLLTSADVRRLTEAFSQRLTVIQHEFLVRMNLNATVVPVAVNGESAWPVLSLFFGLLAWLGTFRMITLPLHSVTKGWWRDTMHTTNWATRIAEHFGLTAWKDIVAWGLPLLACVVVFLIVKRFENSLIKQRAKTCILASFDTEAAPAMRTWALNAIRGPEIRIGAGS